MENFFSKIKNRIDKNQNTDLNSSDLSYALEKEKKAEQIEFLNSIQKKILETFPFETKEEENAFIEEYKKTEQKICHNSYSNSECITYIQNMVSSLHNSHTYLIQDDPERLWYDNTSAEKYVDSKMLSDTIGYLAVNSWQERIKIGEKNIADLVEDKLKNIEHCQSFIIDVRNNTGGFSRFANKLARHFVDTTKTYCSAKKRINSTKELSSEKFTFSGDGIYKQKKVIVLIGPKCFSSTEMFILMMKSTGMVITIGQKTRGGSGGPTSFDLSFDGKKYWLSVSTWKLYLNNGEPLEGRGITPDIEIVPHKGEQVSQHDEELEAAVRYLNNVSR